MPVIDIKTFTGESIVLHALVVVGADGVEIGSLAELLELLRSVGEHRNCL